MRVLHIINNLGSGGAEKLIEETLPLLNKIKGIQADVLLLTDYKNVFDKKLKENYVNVDVIPSKKLYSPKNIFYIRNYIIKGKYDIVHAHLFPTIYWTSLASKGIFKDKPKFIMTEHNTHNRRRNMHYLKPLEKFIYSSYSKIISISRRTQDNLILWLKPKQKEPNKFTIIENGIDIDRFKDALPYKKSEICSGLTEDVILICMVGSFSEQKDQPTLIKAMKELPQKVHLLLIGEGPLKLKNQDLAKALGIKDRVHFLGFRNDVERIYKTADVIVLSSHWEGFGLVAAEGMASGKPVIASDVHGLAEVVGGAGVLFEKGNSKELVSRICKLITDRQMYSRISEECLKRSERFSIKRMVAHIDSLYRGL